MIYNPPIFSLNLLLYRCWGHGPTFPPWVGRWTCWRNTSGKPDVPQATVKQNLGINSVVELRLELFSKWLPFAICMFSNCQLTCFISHFCPAENQILNFPWLGPKNSRFTSPLSLHTRPYYKDWSSPEIPLGPVSGENQSTHVRGKASSWTIFSLRLSASSPPTTAACRTCHIRAHVDRWKSHQEARPTPCSHISGRGTTFRAGQKS